MWPAVLTLSSMALAAGLLLAWARRRLPAGEDDIVERVDAVLPQTQCAQCGYPGCRPYAAAIVAGEAPINLCPPGGEETVQRLAALLGRDPLPLAAEPVPMANAVAVIDESLCIASRSCVRIAPEVFELGSRNVVEFVDEIGSIARDQLLEACEQCPVGALIVREDGEQVVP